MILFLAETKKKEYISAGYRIRKVKPDE